MPDKFKIIEETETRLNCYTWVSYDGWDIRISQPEPGAGWDQVELSLPELIRLVDIGLSWKEKYNRESRK